MQKIRTSNKEIIVFNGPDEQFVGGRLIGADGGIGGTYGVMPELFIRLNELVENGENEKARFAFAKIFPLCGLLFAETSPTPVKEALRLLGVGDGSCRLPPTPPSAALAKQLAVEISRLFS